MRLNKYIALASGLSRRAADTAISESRVTVNGVPAATGQDVSQMDIVVLDGRTLALPTQSTTILLHKPAGYVVSRAGQGSKTIYELLPKKLQTLKPVGRLDKDSSGVLLLTNDGGLANELTHPRHAKTKIYEITLDNPLQPLHRQMINDYGVQLDDGPSKLNLERLRQDEDSGWQVTMREGRNRQIRRTFASLGYTVTSLHRTQFGPYRLEGLAPGSIRAINSATTTPHLL